MTVKFRWLIVDEDYNIYGTNSEDLKDKALSEFYTVIDTTLDLIHMLDIYHEVKTTRIKEFTE